MLIFILLFRVEHVDVERALCNYSFPCGEVCAAIIFDIQVQKLLDIMALSPQSLFGNTFCFGALQSCT